MALEPKLIKLPIVKGAEFRRQATEGPDKPELRGNEVNDETEPHLLGKLEAMLGFTLHLNERISRRQKVRVQVVRQLYAAKVRSPILFAASNARRSRSRPARTCFVQGMTRFPKHT